ncbi:MAG: type I-C CRISPR-associated protein Cas5c [bacterium]
MSNWLSVRVKGEFACFTRPEAKVERVTYPIMTPSAARGILEAIFWHPQFVWRVHEIHVLSEVRTFSLVRNELNSKMSIGGSPLLIEEDRTQRHAVCLRDVDYAIYADVEVKPDVKDDPAKYRDQFRRRVERGQCFHRPALGCREFAAEFGPMPNRDTTIDWNEDLGLMLWDLDYKTDAKGNIKPPHSPLFFHAIVESGVLKVPNKPLGVER